VTGWLARVLWLVTFPATLAHEATHVLAALPWAREVTVRFRPGRDAEAEILYPPGTPRWLVRAHALAPFALGVASAVVSAAVWLETGAPVPSDLAGQVAALYLAYSLGLYAVHSSGDDLRGGGGEGA
jgi:hypothetical protein